FSDMFHSFGPASGGTWAERFQISVCKYKPCNAPPFPFALRLAICSVVERRLALNPNSVGFNYTTRQFAWVPQRRPAECPIPDIFAWNLSLHAKFAALFSSSRYLRRLRRSTISRYRSGSRRLR